MDGICETTVPVGPAGICGYSAADKRPLFSGFPLSALLSTTAGDSQDSKHTRGASSCPLECPVIYIQNKCSTVLIVNVTCVLGWLCFVPPKCSKLPVWGSWVGVSGVAASGQWQCSSTSLIGQVCNRGAWLERNCPTAGYGKSTAGEYYHPPFSSLSTIGK